MSLLLVALVRLVVLLFQLLLGIPPAGPVTVNDPATAAAVTPLVVAGLTVSFTVALFRMFVLELGPAAGRPWPSPPGGWRSGSIESGRHSVGRLQTRSRSR